MLLLVAMTAFIVIQVVGRNVFNAGLPWAEELARYCGLGVVYLTVPLLLLARQAHQGRPAAGSGSTGASKRVLELVNELLVLAFCVIFLTAGWQFLKRASQFSTRGARHSELGLLPARGDRHDVAHAGRDLAGGAPPERRRAAVMMSLVGARAVPASRC